MADNTARVLLVDDQQGNLDALAEALEPLPIKLIATTDPSHAIELVNNSDGDFAAALLDVQMPKIDGFQLANSLNQLDISNKPPILFLTAIHKEDEYVQQGYYAGAVDYLAKPINIHILRAKILVFVEIYLQNQRNITLSKQLSQTVGDLEAANNNLGSFAYIVSHDLKAPLRHLEGFVRAFEPIENGQGDLTPEQRAEYLGRMRKSIVRMRRIIDDILNFARHGLSQVRKEPVKLSRLFATGQELLDSEIKRLNAEISIVSDVEIDADEEKFGIVLTNLVENALKYRNPARRPKIEVTGKADDEFVEISVSDNGLGIEAGHQRAVFEFMKRLHSEDEIPGSGIGLSTCEKIVSAHGGTISIASDGINGSTFTIQLPKKPTRNIRAN